MLGSWILYINAWRKLFIVPTVVNIEVYTKNDGYGNE
ncbi:hypothetical protein QF042_001109 [Pedobacter sp. W3I1]|nr:hypothetical protein [Pedobacter sp. W3I1]